MAWTKAKTLVLSAATFLLLCAGTGFVIFETTRTTGVAAKSESNPVADQSTPKGTLLVMSRAMEAGDAKAYVDCFAFLTPEDLRLQAVLERLVAANAKFKQALSDKFGPDAANAAFSVLGADAAALAAPTSSSPASIAAIRSVLTGVTSRTSRCSRART